MLKKQLFAFVLILLSIVLISCGVVPVKKPTIPNGLLIEPAGMENLLPCKFERRVDLDTGERYRVPVPCDPMTERCGYAFDADGAAAFEEYVYKLESWINENGE